MSKNNTIAKIREAATLAIDFAGHYLDSVDARDIPESWAVELISHIEDLTHCRYHRHVADLVLRNADLPHGTGAILKRHFSLAY